MPAFRFTFLPRLAVIVIVLGLAWWCPVSNRPEEFGVRARSASGIRLRSGFQPAQGKHPPSKCASRVACSAEYFAKPPYNPHKYASFPFDEFQFHHGLRAGRQLALSIHDVNLKCVYVELLKWGPRDTAPR
jgi:hypothetical protein